MIQDKIFFDEKDPTGLSYNTPFTFYGSYQGRLWSKAPGGEIKYYTQNSDLSVFATTGSNQFNGNQAITGSLTVTGGITGTATTASYVEYSNVANKPTLVSGSSQVTYSGLSGIPSGIVSGSAQIASFGIFATTGSNGFNGSQSITGSLTVTGQVVAQTLNVQQVTSSIVYSSGSNIFGNSLANTQQFTGSVGVTGSLTINGTSAVVGSGTTNYVPKFTACNTIGNSIIQEVSSNIGIGVSPSRKLHVLGGAGTAQIQSSGASSIMYFGDACSSVIDNQGFGSVGNSLFLMTGGFERLLLNCSGNLGLGVTPSAWGAATTPALQITSAALFNLTTGGNRTYFTSNAFFNGTNFIYLNSTSANMYLQYDGSHQWFQAPSGTAGNAISFTQAMTLDACGNLLIGETSNIGSTRRELVIRGANGSVVSLGNNTTADRFQIASDSGENALLNNKANTPMIFYTNNTERLRIFSTGAACFACELTAKSLGTNDLILNNLNHEHANYVDGTRGSWLIQEGACDLFIINQVSCKKYKFNLIEIK